MKHGGAYAPGAPGSYAYGKNIGKCSCLHKKTATSFPKASKTVFSKRIVFSEVELSGSLCGWGMRNMIFPCCGLMINIVHKLIAYVTAVNC